MPVGLQIWDSDGRLEVDTTTRLASIIDTAVTSASAESGSRTYDISPTEEISAFGNFSYGIYSHYPKITVTYNAARTTATVAWSYPAPTWTDGVVFKSYGTIYIMVF